MSINGLGVEREPPPVTLSRLRFLEQPEPENDTSRFATERVIRAGLESWEAITKAESFEGWKAIGKALAIGRDMALHSTGANAPMGRRYSAAFSAWINRHGFDRMPKSTRSVALELNENLDAIETWRATLTEKQRRQRIHPLSNVAAWKKATKQPKADDSDDVANAATAWKRFIAAMGALPLDQAQPLWEAVRAHAAGAGRAVVVRGL